MKPYPRADSNEIINSAPSRPVKTWNVVAFILAFLSSIFIISITMMETDTTTVIHAQFPANLSSELKAKAEFQKAKAAYKLRFKNSGDLGGADAEPIISTIAVLKERQAHSVDGFRYIIDIGANQARLTSRFITHFTAFPCKLIWDNKLSPDLPCRLPEYDNVVLSFEPMPKTFGLIKTISDQKGWEKANWVGVQAAISNSVGRAVFYSSDKPGDEEASLHADGNAKLKQEVPLLTVDDFLFNGFATDLNHIGNPSVWESIQRDKFPSQVLLLKIDVEGFDPYVLEGAKEAMLQKRIKFIIFEYNDKWFWNGHTKTLRQVTQELNALNYDCYWVTWRGLIPVFGEWWDDSYEIKMWSNIICGMSNDHATTWVVNAYNALFP